MKLTRDILLSYVQNTLPEKDARAVAAALQNDPGLARYVEEQIKLKQDLDAHFALPPGQRKPIAPPAREDYPAPPLLAQDAADSALEPPVLLPAGIATHALFPAGLLALGLILGLLLADSAGMGGDIAGTGGRLIAQGALAKALSVQAQDGNMQASAVAIRESFVNRDGDFCRVFQMKRTGSGLSGIACRSRGQWRLGAVSSDNGETAPLLGIPILPAPIRDARDAMIVGEPLDDAAQQAAQKQGWNAH